MIRKGLAFLAVATLLAVTACEDEAEWTPPEGVLQGADLPAGSDSGTSADAPPPIGAYCQKEYAGILGPSFDPAGVEYAVGEATVTSIVASNPEVGEDRIPQIRREIERCAAATRAPHTITPIDLGDHQAAFAATADPAAQAPAGEVAVARVDRTYVIVAITDAAASDLDLGELLERAVDRAQDADRE